MQFRRFGRLQFRKSAAFAAVEGRNYTADEQLTLEGQTTTEGQIKSIESGEKSVAVHHEGSNREPRSCRSLRVHRTFTRVCSKDRSEERRVGKECRSRWS